MTTVPPDPQPSNRLPNAVAVSLLQSLGVQDPGAMERGERLNLIRQTKRKHLPTGRVLRTIQRQMELD